MSDRFHPISLPHLWRLIINEYKQKNSIFGIPESLFFNPDKEKRFNTNIFGHSIDTPLGVAAGPQTQMAQNIVASWLMGSRYIELKTIQTLDELDISKPCIDMQDEGYNCEWSQELKIKQSFDEYLNAWIIIHLLHNILGFKGQVDTVFNMSVGYDMQGIKKENIQWFLKSMKNAGNALESRLAELKPLFPDIDDVKIPQVISDNITLSTMHGCPSNEIEEIADYLMGKHHLHTFVKLNPTLLGPEKLREILNDKLKFTTTVPDEAFNHDLKYNDAVKIINSLQKTAAKTGLIFGLKLTNTLESLNTKSVFSPDNEMMYMSGRALHPIAIQVAKKLQQDFSGKLNLSFSAGIDAFNVSEVVSCGFKTITVCSDLLKPGGYTRMAQYFTNLSERFDDLKVDNIKQYVEAVADNSDIQQAEFKNLKTYADKVINSSAYRRNYVHPPSIKTHLKLDYFDCINAPCEVTCPTNQDVPSYMYYTANGDFESAYKVITETNAFPNSTGMVCDHVCQTKCTRINYDETVAIRDIKRFVVEWHNKNEKKEKISIVENNNHKIAIIGAGPTGLSAAYFLLKKGFQIKVFEQKNKPGGMVSDAIPKFRIPDESVMMDVSKIVELGAEIHYNYKVTKETFHSFKKDYDAVVVAVGAQDVPKLNIPGINALGVIESLDFLEKSRQGKFSYIGNNIVVIGGGNTAMDIARTAYRLSGDNGKVTILYRRTIEEMPAVYQEVLDAMEEGVNFVELAAPVAVIQDASGKVTGLKCIKMKPGDPDESGRHRPILIQNSEFDLAADVVIPAIGQKIAVDFTDINLLTTKTGSLETKIPNVYIGGDARLGASSLVNGVGDGRKIAAEITKKFLSATTENDFQQNSKKRTPTDINQLMLKKSVRIWGWHPKELPLDERKNFQIVTGTFTEKEAVKEASRCLLCDEVCNICTTVCPNFANYYYETEKQSFELSNIYLEKNSYKLEPAKTFTIKQGIQILNIDNFCNECGNCDTFCPTAGAPYKSKPKIFLTRASFEEATDGYYLETLKEGKRLLGKKSAEMISLEESGQEYIYTNRNVIVRIKKSDFSVLDVEVVVPEEDKVISLAEAANMHVILQGAAKLAFD